MSGRRPVQWRASWALAQVTGVLFSSAVWIVILAAAPAAAVGALLAGIGYVAAFRTRPVLWLAFGARSAAAADRDAVLRAIVPVASLRGRSQPQVWVARGHRATGWDILSPGGRTLLVSEHMLALIRSCRVSDEQVSALAAHAFGQLPALGSRVVLAVGTYCLPWWIAEAVKDAGVVRLSRIPLMPLSWRMRPIVFGLGLLDAVQHGRWEAAIPLVVLAALTYTTRPLNRAWDRKLAELGDRHVADEGLGSVFAGLVLDPRDPGDRRRAETLLAVAR